jgi:hypothetical protein
MDYSLLHAPEPQFRLGGPAPTPYRFESMADQRFDLGLSRPPWMTDGIDPYELLQRDLWEREAADARGAFPGVEDLTSEPTGPGSKKTLSDLGWGTNPDPKGVILHRTDADKGTTTLDQYKQAAGSGQGRKGAPWLIDENGKVILVTPMGKHLEHTRDDGVDEDQDHLGIEITGKSTRLDVSANGLANMEEQVKALNLPPRFKQRLLADPNLASTVHGSGMYQDDPGGLIYEDINAAQKRGLWNLAGPLCEQTGLDPGTDFKAHEHVQAKTLGEGEAAVEFLQTMKAYPDKVRQLRQLLLTMSETPPEGVSPEDWDAQRAELEAMVLGEEATLTALQNDNLVNQQTDDADRDADGQHDEQLLDAFYGNFYERQAAIDAKLPAVE